MLLAVAGCSHHPTITYPKVPEVGAAEAELDCPGIEASIARADTVRWVMREDGAYLLTETDILGRRLIDVAAILSPPVLMAPVAYEGHFALNDIDRRLRDLLALKRGKGCAPTNTGHPGMTDLQLMERLLEVMDEREQPGAERQRLDERTRLLDDLRDID